MADLAAKRLEAPVIWFELRGQSPAFDGVTLHVCGEPGEKGASLWTEQGGRKSMVATISCGVPY